MNSIYYLLPHPLKVVSVSIAGYLKHHHKYGTYCSESFDFLMHSSLKEQEKRASTELETFLHSVKKRCSFYSGVIPRNLNIYKIPIVDKTAVLEGYKRILWQKPFKISRSSGTTGQPITVPYSKNVYQKEYAFWLYHVNFGNVKMGEKIATIAGHKITSAKRDIPPFWVLNAYENQIFFSSYHLSNKNLPYYLERLNSFKPNIIHGYPSSIYMLAKYVLENDVTLSFVPKMIVTSSEETLDFHRTAIENAFKCKLYVWYGNTEYCGHITECPYGKMHIQPYHSFVRIVGDNNQDVKEGQVGRIVATNFSNYAFPLINYDTKDVVRLSASQECSCNRGGMIVDFIHGRIQDYVITPEGRTVYRLGHLFKDAKSIRNAQIVQNSLDEIVLRIEKENSYSKAVEKTILKEARSRLGGTIKISFDYVNEIEKLENGKFRFIVQNIAMSQAIGHHVLPISAHSGS